jgi:2'-5' RNA ligase
VRLFLAIDLPPPARAAVGTAIDGARKAAGDAASALRWSVPENLHLTLHFIGELDGARLPALTAALGDTVPVPPFEVSLGRLGVFPPRGRLRTLWIAIDDGRESLVALHAVLGERLARARVAVESRPFVPHLTLARARDRDRSSAKGVAHTLAGLAVLDRPERWTVDRVTLMRSDLSGPRPRYESIKIVTCCGQTGTPLHSVD